MNAASSDAIAQEKRPRGLFCIRRTPNEWSRWERQSISTLLGILRRAGFPKRHALLALGSLVSYAVGSR